MQNKYKIAVIGAMDCEVNTLKECLKNIETINHGKLQIFKGNIASHEIMLAKSGVGKVCAALNTQYIIDNFKPDYIINTGIAGGIAENMGGLFPLGLAAADAGFGRRAGGFLPLMVAAAACQAQRRQGAQRQGEAADRARIFHRFILRFAFGRRARPCVYYT